MRPLTHETPKPLLKVGGVPLLEHHLVRLRDAGVSEVVVNASYLGDQIAAFCGDGGRWGLRIRVSREAAPLETAGGSLKPCHSSVKRPLSWSMVMCTATIPSSA